MRKGYRLQALVYSLIIYLLLPVACNLSPVYAADSTPSADPLRQSDNEASIKTKLEELKKEIASKAAQLKKSVDRKLKDKAYVGTIKANSETSLTLAVQSGPKIVSINQDTVFENKIKGKSKFSTKTISTNDYIAALGDIDETGVMTAKKIILLPTPNSKLKTYLWGQIVSISDKLVTLKDKNFKSVAAAIPSSPAIKLNNFVILTGSINKNEIFDADFSYVISQGTILRPKKIATSSAKVATPSAKPTKKIN